MKKAVFLMMAAGVLSACATVQGPAQPEAVPFKESPGDVTFGDAKADVMYKILVGELAAQRGMVEVAADFYLDAARQSRNVEVASRAVRIAGYANRPVEALEAAKIWVDGAPGNLDAQRFLAVFYLRNGQYNEAYEQFEALLAQEPAALARNLLHIGSLLQRESSPQAAFDLMGRLVAKHPEVAEGQYVLARLAQRVENHQAALEAVDAALKLREDWADAVILRAAILQGGGDMEAGLNYLNTYLRSHPDNDAVRLSYARALLDGRRLKEARQQYETMAVRMPQNEEVLFALSMLALQFNDVEEAKGYLLQLYKLGKRDARVIYYLGQIAEQEKHYEEALDWYARVRQGEFYLDAQLRTAAVLAKVKSLEEARAHLAMIPVESDDDRRELILFEGGLLREAGEFVKAHELFGDALEMMPQDVDLLYARALVAERLNRVDEALEDLRYVVEQQPDNAAALNALGYTLADRTTRYEEALRFISKAYELEPADPAILDSMGWVYYRLGDYVKSLEFLRQAHKEIQDGEVAAHLGEVLWVSGQQGEARQVWQKALKEHGDNEVLKRTLERYKP